MASPYFGNSFGNISTVSRLKETGTKKRAPIAKMTERPEATGMATLQEMEAKLADARREVRNLTVMRMRPDLRPDQLAAVHLLERSARAEVKLRKKALDYEKQKSGPE